MYRCKSWIIKKAEHWRTDAFELWCWRRLLRVPWTARRSNQSILMKSVLNIHWKDWCWSWSSYTLATWCKELTHLKRPWCWEKLKVGEGDDWGWDGGMASLTQWTRIWASSRSWWWTGKPGVLQSMGIREILQARILEWVAMTSSRGSSQTRDRTLVWSYVLCLLCLLHWQVDSLPIVLPAMPILGQ